MNDQTPTQPRRSWQARLALGTFDLLYRVPALYWLASTIPFAGQWRRWQRLVLPRITGHTVLEVGCGPGWLLADMIAAGYECRAVDASPQMVRAARRMLARQHLTHDAATVQEARAQALPFADASFDTVVSTFPAPYIMDPASLREIARVLRPGGRLVVVEGANLLPRGPLLWLLVQFQRLVYGRAAVEGPSDATQHVVLARRIPMEQADLIPTQQIVHGPFWRAYLAMGTKPE
jgi:ubiquinone/menaquinone biosynthesis C-methylase UbiE